jgi:hypothetical protein
MTAHMPVPAARARPLQESRCQHQSIISYGKYSRAWAFSLPSRDGVGHAYDHAAEDDGAHLPGLASVREAEEDSRHAQISGRDEVHQPADLLFRIDLRADDMLRDVVEAQRSLHRFNCLKDAEAGIGCSYAETQVTPGRCSYEFRHVAREVYLSRRTLTGGCIVIV